MSVIQFPSRSLGRGSSSTLVPSLSSIAHDITVALMKAQQQLLGANTAEGFAAAVEETHETRSKHAAECS